MIKVINILVVICLIIVVFILAFLSLKFTNKLRNQIFVLLVLIFILFLGFRDIGLDLEPYRVLFNNQPIIPINEFVTSNIFSYNLEPFFVFLISTIKNFGLGFNWFLLIAGGIPMYIIYKIIKQNEKDNIIFLFLLFLLIHFLRGPIDIIRHFFAASIYLSALISLARGKETTFWLKSTFSTLIHYSNVGTLIVRPFLSMNWNKLKFTITLLIIILFGFLTKLLINSLSIQDFLVYDNPIIWKLGYYLTYFNQEGGYQYSGILHEILLKIISHFPLLFNLTIVWLCLAKVREIKKDNINKVLLNSQIFGTLIALFFVIINASTLGMRLNFLFCIGNFILLKELIFNYNKSDKKVLISLIIFALVFYNFLIILYFAGIHDPNSPFYLYL